MKSAEKKLQEYLGTWGCQCRMMDFEDLADMTKIVFDVPGRNLQELANAVERLGRVKRSARVREAIRKHWPEPTILWPAHAPVRKALAKELKY